MVQRIDFRIALVLMSVLMGWIFKGEAQNAPGYYYVVFKDKLNTPYSLEYPQAFLSQKSLDRRLRLGIPLLEEDLPVNPQYVQSVIDATGGTKHHVSKWFNSMTINLTSLDSAQQLSAVDSIMALGFVQEVKDYSVHQTQQLKERKAEEAEVSSIGLNLPMEMPVQNLPH